MLLNREKSKNQGPATNRGDRKFRGARRSKVDPKTLSILQHEADKLRIFKIAMSLFLLCVVAAAVAALVNYRRTEKSAAAYIQTQRERLLSLERQFSSGKPYESAVAAVKAIRVAERVSDFADSRRDADTGAEMQAKMKEYNRIISQSFPKGNGNYVSPVCCLDMVWIPAGTFEMGSDARDAVSMPQERPKHSVTLSKPFWISRREVDVWQFRRIIPAFRIPVWNGIQLDNLNFPVGRVTWEEAMFFCQKLTSEERRRGLIPPGYEYRLPTEAEWEYCARGGSQTMFYWGDVFGTTGAKYANSLDKRAADRFGWRTVGQWGLAPKDAAEAVAPTASFKSNSFGLYDMLGNVSEWCLDSYDPDFYARSSGKDVADVCNRESKAVEYVQFREFDAGTVTREIPCKVIRGGNWGNVPEKCRCAARDFMPQNESNNAVGFRVVLAPSVKMQMSNSKE